MIRLRPPYADLADAPSYIIQYRLDVIRDRSGAPRDERTQRLENLFYRGIVEIEFMRPENYA